MLALLLSWLHIAWLSTVFGIAGLRSSGAFLQEKRTDPSSWAADHVLLLGFLIITALTGALSLFSPIDIVINLAFLLAGVALTIRYKQELRAMWLEHSRRWRSKSPGFKAAVIAIGLVASLAAFIDIGESDTWFYHSQSILWIKEYGIVPGLGNIHGRFAFNSHFFVASALFAQYFSEEQVIFPLLSFFYMLFMIRLLVNLNSALKEQNWFFFSVYLLLFILSGYQFGNQISGTGTDEITAILLFYVFFLFLESGWKTPVADSGKTVILWTALCSAITFKISAVFMMVLAPFLLPKMLGRRRLSLYIGLAVLILAPFIGRNILLSGYLLYPVPELDLLSVDWKIPLQDVIVEKELIEGWAKQPDGMNSVSSFEDIPKILDLSFSDWFRVWWPEQSIRWKLIMILSAASVVPLFLSLFRKKYVMAVLYGTVLINLAFWFAKAPEPRFAFAFLFLGATTVLASLVQPAYRLIRPGVWVFPLTALFLISMALFRKDNSYFPHWEYSYLLSPCYDVKIETQTYNTQNFTLIVPGDALPAKHYFCHNAPLPCTPFPKANLALRGVNYRDGFRIVPEAVHAKASISNVE